MFDQNEDFNDVLNHMTDRINAFVIESIAHNTDPIGNNFVNHLSESALDSICMSDELIDMADQAGSLLKKLVFMYASLDTADPKRVRMYMENDYPALARGVYDKVLKLVETASANIGLPGLFYSESGADGISLVIAMGDWSYRGRVDPNGSWTTENPAADLENTGRKTQLIFNKHPEQIFLQYWTILRDEILRLMSDETDITRVTAWSTEELRDKLCVKAGAVNANRNRREINTRRRIDEFSKELYDTGILKDAQDIMAACNYATSLGYSSAIIKDAITYVNTQFTIKPASIDNADIIQEFAITDSSGVAIITLDTSDDRQQNIKASTQNHSTLIGLFNNLLNNWHTYRTKAYQALNTL